MKLVKISKTYAVLVLFLSTSLLFSADLMKGANITNWLTGDEAGYIQTTRYQKVDFENIKALGFDHVRIHVTFNTPEAVIQDYKLAAIQAGCLDKAIMWAEELGLKTVITNVGDEIATGTVDAVQERLVKTWKDVAGRYASRGDVVAYEIFAAPGETITAEAWNGVAAAVVAAIREVDTSHSIIVGSVNNYALDALSGLSKFNDANVLYAFNFYDPMTFTRQGDAYNDVDYNTAVVPFPYDVGKMPAMSADDTSAVAIAGYENYPTQGNIDFVKSRLDVAAQFATTNGVKMYCANFGVRIGIGGDRVLDDGWVVPEADRGAWLGTCASHMQEKGMAWAHSYIGAYGLFYDYGHIPDGWMQFSNYPYDIIKANCDALGLTAPEPGLYSPDPLADALVLFDEEVTPLAKWGQWWGDDSEHSLFNMDEPAVSQYCLSVFYPGQYCAGDFFFPLYLDMSALAEDGYVLDFFIRCDWEEAHIQARFEDTNEYFEDHPWRMNYHVDNNVVPFDGDWQRVTIPLTDMQDQGAWDPDDRIWYGGPQGLFDWSQVQRFQFVSETAPQPDAEIYIDRVRIVSADAVDAMPDQQPVSFELAANYPNPFNPSTKISYILPQRADVRLSVYNVRGELVKTLVADTRNAGSYTAQWDGTDANNLQVSSGVYLYKLKADNFEQTRRMLLIR